MKSRIIALIVVVLFYFGIFCLLALCNANHVYTWGFLGGICTYWFIDYFFALVDKSGGDNSGISITIGDEPEPIPKDGDTSKD